MEEPDYRKVICECGRDECPCKKDHCWLGEIDVRSLNGKVPLQERHKCKHKKGLMVIGRLVA